MALVEGVFNPWSVVWWMGGVMGEILSLEYKLGGHGHCCMG